jgi:hypothetical protein
MSHHKPISILVLGAGELGLPILEALATHAQRNQTQISVLLRQSSASKQALLATLARLDINTAYADIGSASVESLTTLFANYDTIIGATGMQLPAGTQVKIARAVLAAKVALYLPWQFGVNYDIIGRESAQGLFSEQLDVRDLLRAQSETEWVIVSTGMFVSFLFEKAFGVVDLGLDREQSNSAQCVVRALGSWENRVSVTTVEDIGRVVAEIVFSRDDDLKMEDGKDGGSGSGQVVFTAGNTIEYSTLADVVEKVSGREVRREVWSIDMLKEDLRKDPENGMKKYRVVFAEGTGVSWDEENTFNSMRGLVLKGVEKWLEELLA